MKRYNIMDEVESLTGRYVEYSEHEREIGHYDKTDEIQENLILKLKDKIQEMIDDMYSAMVQADECTTAKKILTNSILSAETFLEGE